MRERSQIYLDFGGLRNYFVSIQNEMAAEALMDIYSRFEVPQVHIDLETQIILICDKDESRLVSIKRMTITTYHPMCNI